MFNLFIHNCLKFGVTKIISCFPGKLIFTHQINYEVNGKYSQEFDKVRNNYLYLK